MSTWKFLWLVPTFCLIASTVAHGDDVFWNNSLGGDFSGGANWTSGDAPDADDHAIFDLGTAGYTVTSLQDHTVSRFLIGTDDVTLSLGTQTINVVGEAGQRLRVADGAGDNGALRLVSGTIVTPGLGVAAIGGSSGLLELSGTQARLQIVGPFGENQVGGSEGDAGVVRVLSGAQFAVASNVFLGRNGGSGVVTVADADSELSVGGTLAVGLLAHGELYVRDGGRLEAGMLAIANQGVNPSGAVEVLDGSEISVSGLILVAGAGNGSLTVRDGNVQSGSQLLIGLDPGAVGSLTVESGGQLTSGRQGSASGTSGIVGRGEGSEAEALVSGTGSEWVQDGNLIIGWAGMGGLNIEQTGLVESQRGQLGRTSTGNGTVSVVDADSRWSVAEDLTLGGTEAVQGGQGLLEVGLGARVDVGQTLRSWASGTVNLTAGGTIEVGSVVSPLAAGTVGVGPGGTLSGNGTIIGDVVNDGGTVAPGSSPGALHITGNYNQLPGSILDLEIGGLLQGTEYDQLLVSGDLLLEGDVRVAFVNGFQPDVGDTFDLITAGGSSFAPAMLSFMNAPAGFEYTATLDGGVFALTVTAVPEPGTLMLLALAMALLFVSTRNPNAVHQRWGEGLR